MKKRKLKVNYKFILSLVLLLGIFTLFIIGNFKKNNSIETTGELILNKNSPYIGPNPPSVGVPWSSSATNFKCTDYDEKVNILDYVIVDKNAITPAKYQIYVLNKGTFSSNVESYVLVTYTENGKNKKLKLTDECVNKTVTEKIMTKKDNGIFGLVDTPVKYNYVTEYFCDKKTNKPTYTNFEGPNQIKCNTSIRRFPIEGEIFYDKTGNVKYNWLISKATLYQPRGYTYNLCTNNDKTALNLGMNLTIKGSVTAKGTFKNSAGRDVFASKTINDFCGKGGRIESSSGYVTEYICKSEKPYYVEFKCPNGCWLGKCKTFSMNDVSFPQ